MNFDDDRRRAYRLGCVALAATIAFAATLAVAAALWPRGTARPMAVARGNVPAAHAPGHAPAHAPDTGEPRSTTGEPGSAPEKPGKVATRKTVKPPSKKWTAAELIGHLQGRGVPLVLRETRKELVTDALITFYTFDARPNSPLEGKALIMTDCLTDALARYMASEGGADRFAWNQFFFHGNHDFIRTVQLALPD